MADMFHSWATLYIADKWLRNHCIFTQMLGSCTAKVVNQHQYGSHPSQDETHGESGEIQMRPR